MPIGRDVHRDAVRKTLWPLLGAAMIAVVPRALSLECRSVGQATHDTRKQTFVLAAMRGWEKIVLALGNQSPPKKSSELTR